MSWNYLLPTISSLPIGYDCTIPIPIAGLAKRMNRRDGHVIAHYRVYHEGHVVEEGERPLMVKTGQPTGPLPEPLIWRDASEIWGAHSGFMELGFRSGDDRELFESKAVLAFYSIYTKPGRKSFFSDNAYKYGAPPVISQIATFGMYVDGHPLIHLDRDRDLGESISLINPYKRPVVASIMTHDGRRLDKIKIPPLSARNARLVGLLKPGERAWFGQIQLTASNRLVTYNVKHSLHDPTVISDHEHLDPFRADPTHIPAFRALRQRVGKFLKVHGWQ